MTLTTNELPSTARGNQVEELVLEAGWALSVPPADRADIVETCSASAPVAPLGDEDDVPPPHAATRNELDIKETSKGFRFGW